MTFEEFIARYPDSGGRYELHNRTIIEMPKSTGKHSNITAIPLGKLIALFLASDRDFVSLMI